MLLRSTGEIASFKSHVQPITFTCRCMKCEMRNASFIPTFDCGNICPACPKVNMEYVHV